MNTKTIVTLLMSGSLLACVPEAKNGGNLDTGSDGGGSSGSEDTGAGTTGEGATGVVSVGSSSGIGDDSTGGGVPAACEAAGWDDSYATYQSAAEKAGSTYWYTQVTGGLGFELTCSYLTVVEVIDGVIVRRTFEITEVPEGVDVSECVEPYVEEGDEINSHDAGYYDPPALLMEAQYEGCCELLAIEPADEYSTYFDVDADGIVQACGAVFANCDDSCGVGVGGFDGFSFSSFAFGLLE